MSRRPVIARTVAKPAVTPEQVQKFRDDCQRFIDDLMFMFVNPLTDMIENTESFTVPKEYTYFDEKLGDYVTKEGTLEDTIYHYARTAQESDPEGSYLNIPVRLDQIISDFKVVKAELAKSSPGIEYEWVRRDKSRESSPPGSPARSTPKSPAKSPMKSPVRTQRKSGPGSPPRSPPARPTGSRTSASPMRSSGSARIPEGAEEIQIPEDFDLEVTPL